MKPVDILYVDDGDESQKVEKLLSSNGIEYERFDYPSRNFKPPYLISRYGDFKGLEGIKGFINLKKGEKNA